VLKRNGRWNPLTVRATRDGLYLLTWAPGERLRLLISQRTRTVSGGTRFAQALAGPRIVKLSLETTFVLTTTAFHISPVDGQRGTSGQILGFDTQNNPHVAYINTSTRTLKYAYWNGSDWVRQDVHTADSFRFGNSFFIGALDGNGDPHFFFPNGASLFDVPIGYAAPNGDSWTVDNVVNGGQVSSMAIDSFGNPHITFEQGFSDSLRYASFDGVVWSIDRVTGLEGSSNFDSDLVLDANDEPHLFVHERQFLSSEYVTHTYLDGGAWTKDRIASWDDSSDGPEAISAILDGNRFHVLYSTGNQNVFYATRTVSEPLLGDVDLNGVVDFSDISPFIVVLAGGAYQTEADCDGSGTVDFTDIERFIEILIGL